MLMFRMLGGAKEEEGGRRVLVINVGITVAGKYSKKSPIRGGRTGRGSLWGVWECHTAQCPSLVRRTGVVAGLMALYLPTINLRIPYQGWWVAHAGRLPGTSDARGAVVPHHAIVDRSPVLNRFNQARGE